MASKAAAKPVAAGSKAKKGAASLVKGSGRKGARTHTKVHFFRPKTLKLARAPKLKKIPTATKSALAKSYDVIKHPLTSETAMKQIEELNTLVFIVDIKANKKDIKRAVKALYDVTAAKVNTLIRPDGLKKAYVKLTPDHEASEIASRIGII
jgi:large subunit ribosomal protein L23Ae